MENCLTNKKFNIPISRLAFYVGLIIFFALVIIRNVLGIDLPVILLLLVTIAIAFLGNKNEIAALSICCIVLSSAFQYKYALLICVFVYLLKYKNSIKLSKALIPLLLMIAWELLHFFCGKFDFVEALRGFAELILCTMLFVSDEEIDYFFVIRSLAVCSFVIMSLMLFNLLREANFNFIAIFDGTYRFGIVDAEEASYALNFNANEIGSICNLTIIGLMQCIVLKKGKLFDFILLIAIALFGVISMSRTFLLLLLLILVMFVFVNKESLIKKFKKAFVLMSVILVLIAITAIFMPSIINKFIERFSEDDITGGRAYLFEFYNSHVWSSIEYSFFGIGIQDTIVKMQAIYGELAPELVPHNGTIQVLVCWGLPGLAFFIYFLAELISSAKKKNKLSFVAFIPLIFILIDIQAGQLLTSKTALLSLSLAFLSLRNIKKL